MFRRQPPSNMDFITVWGWRKGLRCKNYCNNILVMERGYLGDRFAWTSLGWNGLNGRATWPKAPNDPTRFEEHFGHLVRDWSEREGYALIIGQVRGDAALQNCDIDDWYAQAVQAMQARGFDVRFRPHPEAVKRNQHARGLEQYMIGGTLEEALAGAAVCVTYNSNTGVEATLAGVPVIACDHGAMAWPVCAQGIDAELIRPDRSQWMSDMAWKQWTLDEIANGLAWEHVGAVIDAPKPLKQAPQKKPRTALVLGGADCLWSDIESALDLGEFDGVVACNDAGAEWRGRLDAWVTLHPNKMQGWRDKRRANGLCPAGNHIAHRQDAGIDEVREYRWQGSRRSGSSGLFATKIALESGFDRAVLCGIPMDSQAHFFDKRLWTSNSTFTTAWREVLPHIKGRVRSMSGETAKWLGVPTEDWLKN